MGGAQDRVEIYLIAHPDDDQAEARGLLMEEFATFDAGKARCFLPSDREHLLAVIEAVRPRVGLWVFKLKISTPRTPLEERNPARSHNTRAVAVGDDGKRKEEQASP